MTPVTPALKNWLVGLPKVELHLHLEGAIPLPALWELIKKYGGDPDAPSLQALQDRFRYQDFPHFLDMWMWKQGFLRDYEDLTFIAEAVARDLAAQNIRYVEAFYSPPDLFGNCMHTQTITEAMRKGLDRVPEIEVKLIADLVRHLGPERGRLTLREVNEVKSQGILGIGIGGAEHLAPPAPFAKVYEEARRLGFHTTAHAGEAAGAESVWGALNDLKVERIGHGTRAVEDPQLVETLAERQLPVEMCPISNLRTGVTNDIRQHPIRSFFEKGLLVSVNTDDPKMFNNTLVDEYSLLMEALDFTPAEIQTLVINAIRSSWLPEGRKQTMTRQFVNSPGWNFPD